MGGVEPGAYELELPNRVARELRLPKGRLRHRVGHLLAIENELVVAWVAALQAAAGGAADAGGRVGDVVRAAAGGQDGETHPVPSVHRQYLHLHRVDVAAQLGGRGVDER